MVDDPGRYLRINHLVETGDHPRVELGAGFKRKNSRDLSFICHIIYE